MKNTYQFVNCTDQKFPLRDTFMEAWNDMYQWVKAQLDSGGMSYQVLETAIWIDPVMDGDKQLPIMFYDARDRAIAHYGWVAPK